MNDFALPSAENAPLIRWFWRADADAQSIEAEMSDLHAAGYGGIVLWPTGAQIGYLGAEWMQRARWASAACARQNLALWLADDWAQPSGAGELARGQNQMAARALRFETRPLTQSEARAWQASSSAPLAAWAVPGHKNKPRFGEAFDLLLHWSNPAQALGAFNEDVQVLIFEEVPVSTDIDRLHSGSAQLLIESVHQTYRVALGEWFGTTIRGFWTTGPPLPQRETDTLPWSPGLAAAFAESHHYDLIERLPSLVAPMSEDAVKVRQDFWQTVATLLERNWWMPLRTWCEEHGLQLLVWAQPEGEESYHAVVQQHADPLPALRAGHRFAVSAGSDSFWSRLGSSIAALEDQAPPLVIWPHEKAPQDTLIQWQSLWSQGLGGSVSCASEQLQPYAGQIKVWNQSLTYWQNLFSATRPGARIGMLLATRSAWAHYHPQGHRFTRWVWEDYDFTGALLNELHYGFLLLPEDDFLAAREENGQLFAGRAGLPLDAVIISGATTLHNEVWRRLETFVAAGGKVVCLGLLPRWSEIGRDHELEKHISQTTLLTISDLYNQGQPAVYGEESSTGFPITRQNEREGRLACYQPQLNLDRADSLLRVRQMMKDCLLPGCETQTPGLLFARRAAPNGDIFILVNTQAAQVAHVRLRPSQAGSGALYQLDMATGEKRAMPVWMEFDNDEGGGFSLELTLAASEVRVLQWQRTEPIPRAERANFALESYDGTLARGYALQNGTALVQVRRDERIRTWATEPLRVPPPLLLPDEWQARPLGEFALPAETEADPFALPLEPGTLLLSAGSWHEQGLSGYAGAVDYEQTLPLPGVWENCRVWLELSNLREAVEIWLNDVPCGARLTPPWRFEVTEAVRLRQSNTLRLRIWSAKHSSNASADFPPSGLLGPARLVAYPIVEIET